MKKNCQKIAILLSLLFLCGIMSPVQAQSQDYAILIVGDEGSAEMLREEKVLIAAMAKRLRNQAVDQRLKIYSYHFNKEAERVYCETKLNVLDEDLLFVGIVKLRNKVPLKVVYRVDRIVNPTRAAGDIMDRAAELQQDSGDTVQTAPPRRTQPVNNTPVRNQTSTASGYRVQLGSFAQREYAQRKVSEATSNSLKASIFEVAGPDGDTLYKVLSPVYVERQNAASLLERFHEAGFEDAIVTRTE